LSQDTDEEYQLIQQVVFVLALELVFHLGETKTMIKSVLKIF